MARSAQVLLTPLLLFSILCALLSSTSAATFKCTGPTTTCEAMIGYMTVNATTYSSIAKLFQISSLARLLGANNLTAGSKTSQLAVPANTTLRIPFPCACSNGTGAAEKARAPEYTVVKDDGLNHIAVDIFGGFVTYQEIAAFNNISNPNLIFVGQKVRIPLPCSCDAQGGFDAVHYGHKVVKGSSVEQIANQFGISVETVTSVNGITDPKSLKADQILDLPLPACSSSIRNDSLDYPIRLPNGSHTLTANNCVQCSCGPSLKLQCVPYRKDNNSTSKKCPAVTCPASPANLTLGDSLPGSSSPCGGETTCAYLGYSKTAVFAALTNATCPAPSPAPGGSGVPPSGSPASRLVVGWGAGAVMGILFALDVVFFSSGLF